LPRRTEISTEGKGELRETRFEKVTGLQLLGETEIGRPAARPRNAGLIKKSIDFVKICCKDATAVLSAGWIRIKGKSKRCCWETCDVNLVAIRGKNRTFSKRLHGALRYWMGEILQDIVGGRDPKQ